MPLRTNAAKKLGSFIKSAQQVPAPQPKVTDMGPEGAPAKQPVAQPPQQGAPAIPPPPKGAPKEDIEKKVEDKVVDEKLEEERLKSLETKLDEFSEETVDVLTDIKDVLEKSLLDEDDQDDELEDYKDKQNDLEEEDISVDEFGLEPESLILSNEEETMTASLRNARKARLAKVAEYGDGNSKTLSEEFNYETDKKKRSGPKAPAPQITKVKKDEIPKMLKVSDLSFSLNADKTAWDVLDKDDQPIFTIDKPDELPEDEFASRDYVASLVKGMKHAGIKKTLVAYKARVAECGAVDKDDMKKMKKKDKKEDDKVGAKANTASLIDIKLKYARALKLAMTAMNKNLVNRGVHPIKASMYEMLVKVGGLQPDVASGVIEAGFRSNADEFIDLVIDQADKYMDMDDTAFVEYEAAIGETETQIPEASDDMDDTAFMSQRAASIRKRAAQGSVPITTHTDAPAQVEDKVSRLSAALQFNGASPKLAGIQKHAKLINRPTRF